MDCTLACVMSAAFHSASFFTMFKSRRTHNEFKKSLDKNQLKVYKKIKLERLMIWFKASVMGVLLSLLYKMNTEPGNSASKSCVHSLIYFVTQYLVYSLHPKSDWMLLHLKDKKQTQLWLGNYRTMKMKWHFGLLFGIIGYGFMCYVMEESRKK